MRFFLDTEFHEDARGRLDLISIALVTEGGGDYYAISSEFDPEVCHEWVQENVLPKLGDERPLSRAQIRQDIEAIVQQGIILDGTAPEFWGLFCATDWVLFYRLWGRMLDLPKGWPNLCFDLRQEMARWGIDRMNFPEQDEATRHHALHDARWVRDAFLLLRKQPPPRAQLRWP